MQTLTTEQRRFFEQAVTQYQSDLAADTSVREYLASRGLGAEAASTYRLGAVRNPPPGHERYAGRLVIPYLTPAGPVNIRFRCAEVHACEGHAKYLSLPDAASNLFNVADLREVSPFICVTEGEIDAMTLSLAGLPAVGIPGVSTWQQHYARCLEDFDVIYAFGDGDDAGSKLNSFLAKEARARPVSMPKGMDCNDVYRHGGAEALRRLIE